MADPLGGGLVMAFRAFDAGELEFQFGRLGVIGPEIFLIVGDQGFQGRARLDELA